MAAGVEQHSTPRRPALAVIHQGEQVLLNDPETGMWGLGTGWEMGLFALGKYLRRELPDAPAAVGQGEAPPPEVVDLANRSGQAWAALVEAADNASRTEMTSARDRT